MKLDEYLNVIKKFIIDYQRDFNGYILGLSGGLDSSVLAKLTIDSIGRDRLLVLIMLINSSKDDLEDAKLIVNKFNLNYLEIDLTKEYKRLLKVYKKHLPKNKELNSLAKQNLKARLRMITLYFFAQQKNLLVLGTDNICEYELGYFTKYGDGACDLMPFVYLTKGEVKKIGKILGIPDKILNKKPSAGLELNQTDEKDLGLSYDIIDSYFLGKDIDPKSKQKIRYLQERSNHKRSRIPRPPKFKRDNN